MERHNDSVARHANIGFWNQALFPRFPERFKRPFGALVTHSAMSLYDHLFKRNIVAHVPIFRRLGVEFVDRLVRAVGSIGTEPHRAKFNERLIEIDIRLRVRAFLCTPRHRLELDSTRATFLGARANALGRRTQRAVLVFRDMNL